MTKTLTMILNNKKIRVKHPKKECNNKSKKSTKIMNSHGGNTMIQMDLYAHTPQTDTLLKKGKKYFRVMDRKITKIFFAIMGFVF